MDTQTHPIVRTLAAAGLECTPEFPFHPSRRWRFDFAIPSHRLAVEVEGGVWTYGRHNRAAGFLADMEKYNAAAALGWRVLRCQPDDLTSPEFISTLLAAALLFPTTNAPGSQEAHTPRTPYPIAQAPAKYANAILLNLPHDHVRALLDGATDTLLLSLPPCPRVILYDGDNLRSAMGEYYPTLRAAATYKDFYSPSDYLPTLPIEFAYAPVIVAPRATVKATLRAARRSPKASGGSPKRTARRNADTNADSNADSNSDSNS